MKTTKARHLTLLLGILTGIAASLPLAFLIFRAESAKVKVRFDEASTYRYRYIEDAVGDALDALCSFGSLYASNAEVSEQEFTTFAQKIFERKPYFFELRWLGRVSESERAAYELRLKNKLGANFSIKQVCQNDEICPAQARPIYFPATFIATSASYQHKLNKNNPVYGLDAGSIPEFLKALNLAQDTGFASATGELKFFGEESMPFASRLCLPIYYNGRSTDNPLQRRENLQGFVVLFYRINELVEYSFKGIPASGIDLAIFDHTEGGNSLLYLHSSRTRSVPLSPVDFTQESKSDYLKLIWSKELNVSGRSWLIFCKPAPEFLRSNKIILPWVVLGVGLFLTIVLTLYFESLVNREASVRQLVEERTKALNQANKRIEFILEATRTHIDIIDAGFNMIYVDPAWEKFYGKPQGRKCYEYFMGWDKPCPDCGIIKALETKETVVSEKSLIREGGRPIQVTSFPFQDESGVWLVAEVNVDISERRKLDKMKEEFISTVSHELRTPLAIMREALSQMLEGLHGPVSERQTHFLDVSRLSIDRITRIVENLLDISKIESGTVVLRYEDADIAEVARLAAESLAGACKAKGLGLEYKFTPEKIQVIADKDRVMEVFLNLINNAIKFTNSGYITVSVTDRGENVECAVTDTGVGIAENDIPKLFNKFEQLGRSNESILKGVGLGLAICKGIIELHKGKIWVESRLDEGSSFKFLIPKHPSKAEV